MNLENKTLKSAAEIAVEGKTELESNLDNTKAKDTISPEEIKANKNYDEEIKKQDTEKLTNLRESIRLEQNPQDTNAEHPKTVADILTKNKALVIEPDEIEDTPEFRERIKKITEARKLKEAENNTEQEKGIENTRGFQEAITSGDTAKAEVWLKENSNNEKYDARWLDHRSRDLFRAYRDSGDFEGAQRMIDILPDNDSKKGRIKNLKDVMASTEAIDPLAAEK